MKSRELQKQWWDWLSTSERLLRSLYEQTAALTLRDVERVKRIQPELDSMLERMSAIDQEAVARIHELAGELGVEPHLRSLVRVLEKAEAQQLQGLANRVTVAARNVDEVIARNKTLIQSELGFIDGTLTLLAKAAIESRGQFGHETGRAVLLNEAA